MNRNHLGRILIAGDTMPGGVLPYQKEFLSPRLADYLRSFDLRVGTLESAVGTDLPFDEVKMRGRKNLVYSRDEDFHRIEKLGLDVVSLANNHVCDLGTEGLKHTVEVLDRSGIRHCGAGMNRTEAAAPAVVKLGGKSIALLACCVYDNPDMGHVRAASDLKPGINPLEIERTEEEIRAAKALYDYVFVLSHWGREFTYFPFPECKRMAERMIRAGADGVFGSHPHRIQPMIRIEGRPVCFSLGNFLFPDFYMRPPRPIWYPGPEIDRSTIGRTEDYPYPITEPMRQTWPRASRIGMVAEVALMRDGIDCRYRLTRLGSDNVLDLCGSGRLKRLRMWWMGRAVASRCFPTIYRIYEAPWNLPRRGLHFIARKLKI